MASGTVANGGVAGASRRLWIAGLVAGAAIGAVAGLTWSGRPATVTQPVAFDHRLHVRDLEIACATCHPFDARAPFSGLPATESCASCHAEPLGTSAEEAKVVAAARSGSTLAWAPLHRQPPHVFFSHRLHVEAARIACDACHPTFADARSPPARVRAIRMADCLRCHLRAGAPTRCTACHR
ncbi:MAG TPA: cytochrome c3 family protein [Anaeromyxobacter sp.]|nr:cytochrome c3 family protein [Anaeromyxobacter sp.]